MDVMEEEDSEEQHTLDDQQAEQEVHLVLKRNSIFNNWDHALQYVSEYARQNGFRVAIKERRFSDCERLHLQSIRYQCHRAGKGTKCMFSLTIGLNADGNVIASAINDEHNHKCLDTAEMEQDLTRRRNEEAQKREIAILATTNLPVKRIRDVLYAKFDQHRLSYKSIHNTVTYLRKQRHHSHSELVHPSVTKQARYDLLIDAAKNFCSRALESEGMFVKSKRLLIQLKHNMQHPIKSSAPVLSSKDTS